MLRRSFTAFALAIALCTVTLLNAAKVPRKAPDFKIFLPNKAELPLSTHLGKVVILVFIMTKCSHCQKAVMLLTKIQNEFAAKGLQVIASGVEDNDIKELPAFIRTFHPPFPVGVNNFGEAVTFLEHPEKTILPLPVFVFIDKQGTIVAQYKADEDFQAEGKLEQNVRNMALKLTGGAGTPTPAAPAKKASLKKSQ